MFARDTIVHQSLDVAIRHQQPLDFPVRKGNSGATSSQAGKEERSDKNLSLNTPSTRNIYVFKHVFVEYLCNI